MPESIAPTTQTVDQVLVTASPWLSPSPPGVIAALDSTYSVAGPVLAGFASTIVALVAPAPTSFAAGWIVLDLALISIGTLLIAIQISFHAKAAWATPQEFLDWFPMARIDGVALNELRIKQRFFARQWFWYQLRARRLYHVGMLSFLATIAALVAPADWSVLPSLDFAGVVPFLIGIAFVLLEVWWLVSLRIDDWPFRHLFVAPDNVDEPDPPPPGFGPELYR